MMYDDAFWGEVISGIKHDNHRANVREDTMAFKLGLVTTPDKKDKLIEFAFDSEMRRLKRQPQITLERAIGHICKRETSEPTGAAVQIMSKLSTAILRERRGFRTLRVEKSA